MTVQRPTPSERPAAGKASQALSRLLDSRSLVTRLTRLNVGMLCLTVALCFAMLALGVHRATRNYQVQASTITAQSLSAGVASALVFKVAASADEGFNAATETYEDLVKAGVIDPAKVVRNALQNASSIASLLLTTEALVSEIPEEKKDAPQMPHGGGGMGGMY